MGSDVTLRIVDPARQTVMVEAWIGMSVTVARAHDVLQRAPDIASPGWECWGSISDAEALSIAETCHASGASPDDVRRWLALYPTASYWWILERDY